MPQRRQRHDNKHGDYSYDTSPLPGALAPNSPMSAFTPFSVEASSSSTGAKAQKDNIEKRYLGVRVKMPVRDMLRNIRIAKGLDPKDLQEKENKGSKGDKKRVSTNCNQRNRLKRSLERTKNLEELAIIVEVLEEDLKANRLYTQPNKHMLLTCPKKGDNFCSKEIAYQEPEDESPPIPSWCAMTKRSPTQPAANHNLFLAANSQTISPLLDTQWGYDSGDQASNRQRGHSGLTYSTKESEYQVVSQQVHLSSSKDYWWDSFENVSSPSVQEWNSVAFFLSQMEREENVLRGVTYQELLGLDESGRTLLHRSVNEGKRALVYVVAQKMVDLRRLDFKDIEGKTPLHLAAQRNQHLIVADLISLGANINEKDQYGKTCLHFSAEYGYVRVLEVLKSCMKNGAYIDLDARDVNGLSALQHASIALKSTVHELEKSTTMDQVRLHTLRKEQLMETLECLLQMECNAECLDPAPPILTKKMSFQSPEHKVF